MNESDDPARVRPELGDDAALTEQDEDYAAAAVPPVEQRVRHWHHWRTMGISVATAGVLMIIIGHFVPSHRTMEIGGFFVLAGAVIFTGGVIGGWLTRQRPLD